MKASDLVTQVLDLIEASGENVDLPVIVATNGDGRYIRREPRHVEIQRVCHNGDLRPCDMARCEAAFMALVIS